MKNLILVYLIIIFTSLNANSSDLFKIKNFRSIIPKENNKNAKYAEIIASFSVAYDELNGVHRIIVKLKNNGKKQIKLPFYNIISESKIKLEIQGVGVINPGLEGLPFSENSLTPDAFLSLEPNQSSNVILSFTGTRYADFMKSGAKISLSLKEVTSAIAVFKIVE